MVEPWVKWMNSDANFGIIMANVFVHEGGFADDPHDSGGATKFGITQNTLSKWRGKMVYRDDVKALTKKEASMIYKSEYYEKPKINLLPVPLQGVVLDTAINSGPKRSIRMLQRSINDLGGALAVDGYIGPKTLEACENHSMKNIINIFCNRRIDFYNRIVRSNPSQKRFIKGWSKRANSYRI